MAKVILICGLVGAGTSTYARDLALSNEAIRFSIDEWMVTLFQADWPDDLTYEWAMERVARAEDQMWKMVIQLMEIDTPVILDLGLLKKDHRQKFYDLAAAQNYQIETHLVEAGMEVRWERVQKRNFEKGETYSLQLSREMFDFCENLYERPNAEELRNGVTIRTDMPNLD